MRIVAIGDIHGCSVALDRLLDAIQIQGTDLIITLGDYINHGPDSKGVLDRLIALYRTGKLIPLRGNHELKMLAAASLLGQHTSCEMLLDQNMLASYRQPGRMGQIQDIPNAHWSFVRDCCVDWWETAHYLFVHATIDSRKPMVEQTEEKLFWQKFDSPPAHISGKTLICGHSSQKSGKPLNVGHAICIDTWAYGEGWLTGLDLSTGRVWQTNQQGQVQDAWINDFRMHPALVGVGRT
jgi:serine/threonine protein phosphatase 1